MNIYEKLQAARVQLQNTEMTKTGENKFAKYRYFELSDFLPHITRIFNDLKMTSVICFSDIASLEIINIEEPNEIILFTSPMSRADVKGCSEVQNLGAVQTYLRRYLYVNALDIIENDALDATTLKDDKNAQNVPKNEQVTQPKPTREQIIAKCIEYTKALGYDETEMLDYLTDGTDNEVIERFTMLQKQIKARA